MNHFTLRPSITALIFILVLTCSFLIAQSSNNIKFGERPPINLDKVPSDAYEPGKIRIKLQQKLSGFSTGKEILAGDTGFVITGHAAIDDLNSRFGVRSIKPIFAGLYNTGSRTMQFAERHQAWGFHLWYELKLEERADVIAAVKRFEALAEIQIAEPEYKKELYTSIPTGNSERKDDGGDLSIIQSWVPNDIRLNEQWHYHNTGQQGGSPGKDISLFDAWDIEKGHTSVIVAIIDDGIQFNHPDLAGNMWQNAEGHYGYDFVNNTSNISPGSHGTHVAGTVAAVNNNGIGVAGVAGGSGSGDGVRLMSCQVFTSGSSGGFHLAPIYAADNGAAISQNSWGYTYSGVYDQVVLDAIDYFNANGGGTVMNGGITIFAAGNSNSSGAWYPGYYSGAFSVAATNNQDQKAWYSNYDIWIDISAPGGETNSVSARGVLSTVTGSSYAFYQGTSMACPHASGVAALAISLAYRNGLVLTNNELSDLLKNTTDNHYTENPGYVGQLGTGRLNALAALLEVQSMLSGVFNPQNFAANPVGTNQIDLQWTKNLSNDNVMLVWSLNGIFGTPQNGTHYTVGQTLPGGGIVLYRGSGTSYAHSGLEPATRYFYRVFSYDNLNTYSSGVSKDATTFCEIYSVLPYSQDFDASNALPVCWEIDDNQGNGQVWQFGTINNGLNGTSGNYAYLNSDAYGSGNSQNADLISPVFDFSDYTNIHLSFTHYFRSYQSTDYVSLFYTINNGTTWNLVQLWTSTTANPAYFNQLIPQLSGQSQVRFKWNYTGTWGYYWCVDDVLITGTIASPYADFMADPTIALTGEIVIFQDASAGGSFSTWEWNFGSGASPANASGQGPHQVTYSTIGLKTISLLVDGQYFEEKVDYLSITLPPQYVSATYTNGDIQTDGNFTSLPGESQCPGSLTVSIPEGAVITGVDVSYQITARNWGWKSDQRSYLQCISSGGTSETSLAVGSGNSGGTQSYNRTGLNIANGVTGGGDIVFRLHAGRTWSSSGYGGCSTYNNKVDNNTWIVTVHFTIPFSIPDDESANVHCVADAQHPDTPIIIDQCGDTLTLVLQSIVDEPNPLQCTGTRVYTFSFSDCLGEEHTWSFTYHIQDDLPPELMDEMTTCSSLNLQDLYMNLAEAESFNPGTLENDVAALYTDNCGEVTAAHLETVAGQDNSDTEWTFTYVYLISDPCQNTVSCMVYYSGGLFDTITLVDEDEDCSSLDQYQHNWCLSDAQAFDASLHENDVSALYESSCGEITATFFETIHAAGNSDCNWIFTFVYTISDPCLNTVTCLVNYSGGDNAPPVLVNTNIDCSSLDQHGVNLCLTEAENIDPLFYESQIAALYQDNCGQVDVAYIETIADAGNSDCEWFFTFVYHVSDQCLNTVTCFVNISGGNATAPSWDQTDLPYDVTVSCDAVPDASTLTANDYCGNPIQVVFEEILTEGICPQNYQLIRTWTAIGDCGNFIHHIQVVTVQDNQSPQLIDEKLGCESLSLSDLDYCFNTVPEIDILEMAAAIAGLYTDNCSEISVEFLEQTLSGNHCAWAATWYFSVADACGNTTICEITYGGGDVEAPKLIADNGGIIPEIPQNRSIDGLNIAAGEKQCYSALETIIAQEVNLLSNAELELIAGSSISLQPGFVVQQGATFAARIGDDFCGDQTPVLADCSSLNQIKPEWCFNDALAFDASVLEDEIMLLYEDNCTGILVSYNQNGSIFEGNNCNWTAIYAFIISDECGNSTHCEVVYNGGGDGPVLWDQDILPEDMTVACHEVLDASMLTATDHCGNSIEVLFDETRIDGNCEHNYTLVRTWSAADDCGNSIEHNQAIEVEDTEAPYLINDEENCESLNQSGLNWCLHEAEDFDGSSLEVDVASLFTDNCSFVTAEWVETIPDSENTNCHWNYTFVYQVSDACLNTVTCFVMLSGGDATSPSLADENIDCSSLNRYGLNWILNEAYAFEAVLLEQSVAALYIDNCSNTSATLSDVMISGTDDDWIAEYTFIVADLCGNESECIVTYSGGYQAPDHIDIDELEVTDGDAFCFGATETISINNLLVQAGGSITLIAGEFVHFLPGLLVQPGGHLHAYISSTLCANPTPLPTSVAADVISDEIYTDPLISDDFFRLYPNPTSSTFIIEVNSDASTSMITAEIYNVTGERLFVIELSGNAIIEMDISLLSRGIYFVRVLSGDQTGVKKIIRH